MKIIYEYELIYNEFNLPNLYAVNQRFIEDDFIGYPDDYANLVDTIFDASLFQEKVTCIFTLDAENNVRNVLKVYDYEGTNYQSVAKDVFTKILLTGSERYVFVHHNPEWNWNITPKDEKMFMYLNEIGSMLNIQMMYYIFFGNGGIDYI